MFEDNLKRLRAERGLTQEKLANDLFVTHQTISKWETGKSYPDLPVLLSIARYFGVGMDELVSVQEYEVAKENHDVRKGSPSGSSAWGHDSLGGLWAGREFRVFHFVRAFSLLRRLFGGGHHRRDSPFGLDSFIRLSLSPGGEGQKDDLPNHRGRLCHDFRCLAFYDNHDWRPWHWSLKRFLSDAGDCHRLITFGRSHFLF